MYVLIINWNIKLHKSDPNYDKMKKQKFYFL